jgi:hypothetical protein
MFGRRSLPTHHAVPSSDALLFSSSWHIPSILFTKYRAYNVAENIITPGRRIKQCFTLLCTCTHAHAHTHELRLSRWTGAVSAPPSATYLYPRQRFVTSPLIKINVDLPNCSKHDYVSVASSLSCNSNAISPTQPAFLVQSLISSAVSHFICISADGCQNCFLTLQEM